MTEKRKLGQNPLSSAIYHTADTERRSSRNTTRAMNSEATTVSSSIFLTRDFQHIIDISWYTDCNDISTTKII